MFFRFAALTLALLLGGPLSAGPQQLLIGQGTVPPITPFTVTFTTAGANTITIPTGAVSMTLEIEGGGGGGGGNTGTVVGNGGRTVSTYAISSANWGQTLTLTCGAIKASTGTNNNSGQTGNASTVFSVNF